MQPRHFLAYVLLACATATLPPQPAAQSAAADEQALRVMTFNLRYASASKPNSWEQRRPVTKACIESIAPDVFGTQEGLYAQLRDIGEDLPDYEWIGTGRDGGSHGEFMAVFYRKARLVPLEFDHLWLSDTPNVVGSATWGHTNRRMVTWVRFRDRLTHREFYFWNTHLDHQVQLAREKGASLIRERIDQLNTKLPILLVGDFNAEAGANKAYEILTANEGLGDLWVTAPKRRNEGINSFHNFAGPKPGGVRIDWILGRGALRATAAEIVTFSKDGQYPSDHFPVAVWLNFDGAR